MSETHQELERMSVVGPFTFTLTKRELEELLPFEPKVGARVPDPCKVYDYRFCKFSGTCVVEAVRQHEDGSVTIFAIHYPWVRD